MNVFRQTAMKEWQPVIVEKFPHLLESKQGIKTIEWLSEYCEIHSSEELRNSNYSLNESFGYGTAATLGNTPGMGSVRPPAAPQGLQAFYGGATGSGDKFPSTLPIAMQVASRTVGFEVVPVIPMNGPTGVLVYMDYIYGGGRPGTSEQPYLIKLSAENINATNFIVNQIYWGTSAAPADDAGTMKYANGTKVVEMIFTSYGYYDAKPIFRIGNTYVVDNGTLKLDENINLKQIFSGSAIVAKNDAGYPSTTATNFAAVSGEPIPVKAIEEHIQGFAGAGENDQDAWSGTLRDDSSSADPMGRATGENTYYRTMNLQVFSKLVEAKTVQVAATVTTEQIQDLTKQWGQDVLSMVEGALINEVSQHINQHILNRIFALGWTNNSNIYKTENVTLNFTTNTTQTNATQSPAYLNQLGFTERIPVPAFQNYGDFENMGTLQRRIMTKIIGAGNIILQRGRRGKPNFAVCSAGIATSLQDIQGFTIYPMNNTINQDSGSLYPLGTVAGITFYVDPTMKLNDGRIVVGRKGGDEEPGVKFMPYLMAEKITTIAEGTMSPKIAVKSRYALVEAGHHPETMYYTIYCDSPIW